jgi:ArsR family transcriptional regulator, arsenate/arsenite/antimonite-responsive transcriptional repressor / arsenate reductase (thioredoxin)
LIDTLTEVDSSAIIESMNAESSSIVARAAVYAALGDPTRLAVVDALALGDRSPGELADALGLPSNLLAHHLRLLAQVGVVERGRSEADRRRTYVRLVASAVPAVAVPALVVPAVTAPRVVFVCTHNSARSQLASALWSRRSRLPVASAGTHPARRVHRRAVTVARKHGLALDRARTADVTDVVRPDDLVVAVCDKAYEELGAPVHWSVPDPVSVDTAAAFERAFTDIERRVDRLAAALDRQPDERR